MKEKVKKIIKEDGEITVSATIFKTTKENREKIKVRPFVTEPAKAEVHLGRTIKIDEFEYARLDVTLSMPCYKEEIVSVYNQVLEKTTELLNKEVDKIEKYMKSGR